ncbi:hypothetical protein ACQP2U_13600 [Nocardia sp. CA-084685]|uniref:hypothetical protein n=1 Tax=Nocardia sp. CA-084685 TaxID=3239970 RepID=UPI003D978A47
MISRRGATQWAEAEVRRRMAALRRNGILQFQLDIPSAALGFGTEARLWIAAQPAATVSVGEALARHREVSFRRRHHRRYQSGRGRQLP